MICKINVMVDEDGSYAACTDGIDIQEIYDNEIGESGSMRRQFVIEVDLPVPTVTTIKATAAIKGYESELTVPVTVEG